MVEAQLPFGVALVAAIGISVLIGLIVGFISLRIEGIYLVILTLALSEILRTLYAAIEPKLSLSAKNAILFGKKFPTNRSLMLVTVFLVVIMIVTSNLINSPTGRAMLAMKNSTAAAQAMGISLIKYRLMAFVICTAYASIAGILLMMVVRSADATDPTGYYALITSLNILAAVIIGGY
jgi:branched-chain amino acid transport system permease protein